MRISIIALILWIGSACVAAHGLEDPSPRADLEHLTRADVAGVYVRGDGLGVNESIEFFENGTFLYGSEGCLGTYDSRSGWWTLAAGEIRLKIAHQLKECEAKESCPSFPLSYRVLFWGSRLYVIPKGSEDFLFQELRASNFEPRAYWNGSLYLREGDWKRATTGPPSLVPHPRLTLRPIRGEIVDVSSDGSATINVGSSQGVRVGMTLYDQQEQSVQAFEVIETSPESARLRALFDLPTPNRGPVSTLLFDHALRPAVE